MTSSGPQTHETEHAITFGLLIDGKWQSGNDGIIPVLDKFRLKPFAHVGAATTAQIGHMVDAAQAAYRRGAPVAFERGEILQRAAHLMEERIDDFVKTMQAEAGFTASDAAGEVRRCLETLRLSAEEARRLGGDVIPFDGAPGQAGRLAFTLRVPLGVVAAITPFNSPLNTVTHKVAPAFAAGNAIILKPSTHTPITACKLAEVLIDAGMPPGFLSVLHCQTENIGHLLADPRVRFFAFTGSTEVGKHIQQQAGLRRTQMELGSIAFSILCNDANLDKALPKILNAGYRKAGQVCTSIQLLLVHQDILETVTQRLTEMVKGIAYGDPHKDTTFVGPMISEDAARRVEVWIGDAVAGGARLLAGGARQGPLIAPALLTDINPSMKIGCAEVFGPVMSIVPFTTLDEAITQVNTTPYGLATGIFTNRIDDGLTAARRLEVGGVHINETSSSRVDMMPYGGSKESGFGREGPYYAVHEMTEERVVTISL
ncbi:MAG: aldehyde dehydrogenase family protein [Rhodospirillales bacterium]|nr:aldehyde dehydrogenase family protein [Rhodospirillales bacterium]